VKPVLHLQLIGFIGFLAQKSRSEISFHVICVFSSSNRSHDSVTNRKGSSRRRRRQETETEEEEKKRHKKEFFSLTSVWSWRPRSSRRRSRRAGRSGPGTAASPSPRGRRACTAARWTERTGDDGVKGHTHTHTHRAQ